MIPTLITVAAIVVINLLVIGLVPEGRRPTSAMAWILLILLVPLFGLLFFWLIGSPHVPRKRREEQRVVGDVIKSSLTDVPALPPSPDRPGWLDSAMILNRRLGWLPGVPNNSAELYSNYEQSIQAMADLVDTAERYVHVEYFIVSWDSTTAPFFEALARATKRGVKVRLLFDHLSTYRVPGYKEMLTKFDQAGIEWHRMLPIQPLKGHWRRPDLRNHRKILVVDGRSGFVGSQNVIDSSYHRQETRSGWPEVARTDRQGPRSGRSFPQSRLRSRLVDGNQGTPGGAPATEKFPDGIGDLTCQIVPSGPRYPDENNLRLFNTLIYGAQHRLSITSPYFVPDDSLLYAITTAAQRGVAVELFVGEEGDQFMVHHAQCSYYQLLLEAGVRIYLYPAPFVLHAKHFSVDDHTAVIGSSNMDVRSFNLDFEVSMMCTGSRSLVRRMREVEDMYRSLSREMTLHEWKERSLGKRWVDNVMRLTSAVQ